MGGEEIFDREPEKIERGKWYFEDIEKITGARFDHFDPVIGATLKGAGINAQATLYSKLSALLQSLYASESLLAGTDPTRGHSGS